MTPHPVEAPAAEAAAETAAEAAAAPTADAAPVITVQVESAGRRPVLGEVPLALAIIGAGVGLIVIALHHFRWGNLLIAGSMLAAALLRLVLPSRQAGLLVVRSRFTDVVTMGAIGSALLVLALVTRT